MTASRWVVVAAAVVSLGAGAADDALVRARELYNRGQYDAAITAATSARRRPELADAAGVVLARAHLERYRRDTAPADLDAARHALTIVDSARLAIRDRGEWVLGLGEWLYFDGQFGAAAESFDAALGYHATADLEARDKVIAWWALAIDRQAQAADETRRRALYGRMLERMESLVRSEPASAASAYWLAVGAAGADQLDRAWDAAIAAWVRAPAAGSRTATLRADLDRVMLQWILPERARRSAAGEVAKRAAALRAEWDAVKRAWPQR